jgi:hypothetical protein
LYNQNVRDEFRQSFKVVKTGVNIDLIVIIGLTAVLFLTLISYLLSVLKNNKTGFRKKRGLRR